MIDFGLKGQVVCVTGGASGIGKEVVKALAHDGARIGILDLRQEDIDTLVAEIQSLGVLVVGHATDVRDAASTAAAIRNVESQLGPINGLVASAGISGAGKVEHLPVDEWNYVLGVNATGLLITCQEVGRGMIERGKGSIVAIGSIDGVSGHPGRAHYVASKFAVTGLVKNMALEWGRYGVRVNCIAPNLVDTPLLRRGMPQAFLEKVVVDRTPMGRIACPNEIASATLMLLSDASSYITGVALPVDGGLSAGFFTHQQGADLSSIRLLEAGVYTE